MGGVSGIGSTALQVLALQQGLRLSRGFGGRQGIVTSAAVLGLGGLSDRLNNINRIARDPNESIFSRSGAQALFNPDDILGNALLLSLVARGLGGINPSGFGATISGQPRTGQLNLFPTPVLNRFTSSISSGFRGAGTALANAVRTPAGGIGLASSLAFGIIPAISQYIQTDPERRDLGRTASQVGIDSAVRIGAYLVGSAIGTATFNPGIGIAAGIGLSEIASQSITPRFQNNLGIGRGLDIDQILRNRGNRFDADRNDLERRTQLSLDRIIGVDRPIPSNLPDEYRFRTLSNEIQGPPSRFSSLNEASSVRTVDFLQVLYRLLIIYFKIQVIFLVVYLLNEARVDFDAISDRTLRSVIPEDHPIRRGIARLFRPPDILRGVDPFSFGITSDVVESNATGERITVPTIRQLRLGNQFTRELIREDSINTFLQDNATGSDRETLLNELRPIITGRANNFARERGLLGSDRSFITSTVVDQLLQSARNGGDLSNVINAGNLAAQDNLS